MASSPPIKQTSLDLGLSAKSACKHKVLAQMERVVAWVAWAALVELIAPYYSESKIGRPPFALEATLRVHFMQHWFSLLDPAMEEAFFDILLYRQSVQLDCHGRLPDKSTILRFGKTQATTSAGEKQAGRPDSGHRQ